MSDTAPLPSLRDADWLQRAETRELLSALNTEGHIARAVGGAVRNALLGEPVRDIDIATTSPPDVTTRLADKAGLKTIPTGLEHGTVTVVAHHTPFEVTTLRTDVETFGRHARVAYTDDWSADARRRDFTINALYCDADGTVHDPLHGYPDLIARRVRFIGNAEDRIREDYLRILRFFRFSADYANGALDPDGQRACIALREGLDSLSRERVRAELLRLLVAPHATSVVPIIAGEFLTRLLPDPPNARLFERIVSIERDRSTQPDAIRRLGALSGARPGAALHLRDALRLSSKEFERLARLTMPDPAFDPASAEHDAKAFIYRHGAPAFVDGMMIAAARNGTSPTNPDFSARLGLADRWQPPSLPVRGSDIINLGIPAGPRVGRIFAAFEDWWIGADFPQDPAQLANRLAQLSSEIRDD